jgi:hypothetical protein
MEVGCQHHYTAILPGKDNVSITLCEPKGPYFTGVENFPRTGFDPLTV